MKKGEKQVCKWECEIIQDLIPSYVDEVCSDRSREVVEEHMQECSVCRNLEEQYRTTDFSLEKLEEKELNGLKKIKDRIRFQQVVSSVLTIILMILGFQGFWGIGYVPEPLYYVIMPMCMLGAYHTGARKGETVQARGIDHLLAAGSAAVTIVSVVVMCLVLSRVMAGKRVLGLEMEYTGPLLAGIWEICFVVQLGLFFLLWSRQYKAHVENRFRLCICISGMFLLLVYVGALHRLDSVDTVISIFSRMSAVVLLLGACGTVICYLLARKKM